MSPRECDCPAPPCTCAPEGLPALLRRLRELHNWSQADLGAQLGVGRAQVSNAETGKSDLTASRLVALLAGHGHLSLDPGDWLPNHELPYGSMPVAALLIVNYIGPDGTNQRLVAAKGDSPATTYLGMTVKAQSDINEWDDNS